MSDTVNKKLSYSLEFKIKAVSWYFTNLSKHEDNPRKTSFGYASRKLSLDRTMLTRWIKQKDDLLEAKNKRGKIRLENKSNLCICPLMEIRLPDWFIEKRELGVCK